MSFLRFQWQAKEGTVLPIDSGESVEFIGFPYEALVRVIYRGVAMPPTITPKGREQEVHSTCL